MPTRRRWLQFSLRGFMVVLTIGCLWLGWKVERARERGWAIDAIVAMDGTVYYVPEADSTLEIGSGDRGSHLWADLELVPVEIDLEHVGVSDALYARVVEAKPIRRLDIRHHVEDLQLLEQLNGLNGGCEIVIHFIISDEDAEKVQRLLPRVNVRWFRDLNVGLTGHPQHLLGTRRK